ncbi:MAG: hypothetical protein AB1544_09770 [Pseudomonadota bacterium]|jgi:hypothetical protein
MIGRFLLVMATVWGLAMPVAYGADVPDSLKLEKELQSLSWPGFRSVVEAIPKLKAEVDRHGQLGWQYVRANYRTYPWKKNIDRLDPDQRRQLATLIRTAKSTGAAKSRGPAGS